MGIHESYSSTTIILYILFPYMLPAAWVRCCQDTYSMLIEVQGVFSTIPAQLVRFFIIKCHNHYQLHSAKGTRQRFRPQRRLCRVPFVGHSAKALPSAKKHSAKRSTRQNVNRKKSKKIKQEKNCWERHA
jgi:hypothetical protein